VKTGLGTSRYPFEVNESLVCDLPPAPAREPEVAVYIMLDGWNHRQVSIELAHHVRPPCAN